MDIGPQLRQISRFGALARHIDTHLDDALTLAELAELACMSRHRLDSSFQAYAQETPMSRVWRLRLLRAKQQIMAQAQRPLLDVALDAGYGSAQAFSRAFQRVHGQAPSTCRDLQRPTRAPLRIEALPAMPIQFIPYAGAAAELQHASNELRARAMHTGIARHKRFGWLVDVEAKLYAPRESHRVNVQASLLSKPLEARIPGLDSGNLSATTYAVFSFQTGIPLPTRQALEQRIEQETGWMLADGAWLRRCRNAQYLPSVLESRFELYLPVHDAHRSARLRPLPFILEK